MCHIYPIHWMKDTRWPSLRSKEVVMATNQSTAEHKVKLGAQGPEVRKLALGCMGMSGMYGASDEAEGVRTIHEAIERGINLLDTGDFYGMGHNELLIRKAIEGR